MAEILVDLELIAGIPNLSQELRRAQSVLDRAGLNVPINANITNRTLQQVERLQSQLNRRGVINVNSAGLTTLNSNVGSSIDLLNRFGRSQQQNVTHLEELSRQVGVTSRRFAAFVIAGRGIGLVSSELSNATQEAIKFQREIIRTAQLTDNTTSFARGLGSTINSLSQEFGVASTEIARSANILAQAGRSVSEISAILDQLTPASLTATFGDLANSTENVQAILGQFSLGVNQVTPLLDSFNALTKETNVSVDELFEGLKRAGATFAALDGINELTPDSQNLRSLREFSSLFASIISISRESAATVGTALRTILPRLQRSDVQELLEEQGINVVENGQFVGGFEAISRIVSALRGADGQIDATSTRISGLVEALGGVRQFGRVIPLLTNFAQAQDNLNTQLQSSGSVADDAAKAQEALEVQIAKVRAEFQTLVNEVVDSGAFERLADGALTFARALVSVADALTPLIELLPLIGAIGLATRGPGLARALGSGFRPGARVGFNKGGPVGLQEGGVPVALTPGEGVIAASDVSRIPGGYNTLNRINSTGVVPSNLKLPPARVVPGDGNTDTFRTSLAAGDFVIRKRVFQQFQGRQFANSGGEIQAFGGGGNVRRRPRFGGGGNVRRRVGLQFGGELIDTRRGFSPPVDPIANELINIVSRVSDKVDGKLDAEIDSLINLDRAEARVQQRQSARSGPEGRTIDRDAARAQSTRDTQNLSGSQLLALEQQRRSGAGQFRPGRQEQAAAQQARNINRLSDSIAEIARRPVEPRRSFQGFRDAVSGVRDRFGGGGDGPNGPRGGRLGRLGRGARGLVGRFGGAGIGTILAGQVISQNAGSAEAAGVGGALTGAGTGTTIAGALGVTGPFGLGLAALTGVIGGSVLAIEKFNDSLDAEKVTRALDAFSRAAESGEVSRQDITNAISGVFAGSNDNRFLGRRDTFGGGIRQTLSLDTLATQFRELTAGNFGDVLSGRALTTQLQRAGQQNAEERSGQTAANLSRPLAELLERVERSSRAQLQGGLSANTTTRQVFNTLSEQDIRAIAISSGRVTEDDIDEANRLTPGSGDNLARNVAEIQIRTENQKREIQIRAAEDAARIQRAAAESFGDFSVVLSTVSQRLERVNFDFQQGSRRFGELQAGGDNILTPTSVDTVDTVRGLDQIRQRQGIDSRAFDAIASRNALSDLINQPQFRQRLTGDLSGTNLRESLPTVLGGFRAVSDASPAVQGDFENAIRAAFENNNIGENTTVADAADSGALDSVLKEVTESFGDTTEVVDDFIESYNKQNEFFTRSTNQLNTATANAIRERVISERDFAQRLFDVQNPGLQGTNQGIAATRDISNRAVSQLAGGRTDPTDIANRIRELRSQPVTDETSRELKSLNDALRLSADKTAELSQIQSKLADAERTRSGAESFVNRVATGDPEAIQQSIQDLITLSQGGGQNLSADRFQAALQTGRGAVGSLTDEQLQDRFGLNREGFENNLRRIQGSRFLGRLGAGDQELGQQIVNNQLAGNDNDSIRGASQELAATLTSAQDAQREIFNLQEQQLQQQREFLSGLQDSFTDIGKVFSDNQLNSVLGDLSTSIKNGIEVNTTASVTVDLAGALASSEEFATNVANEAVRIIESRTLNTESSDNIA